ncbi:TPM domain-containing protein [candidate division KSB1 bacterium]
MILKRIPLIPILLVIAVSVYGQEFPEPVGYVNDFARVIDTNFKMRLESLIEEVKLKTGVEIVVVTVKTSGDYDDFEYSVKLFEKWKIGKKDKDTGLMLFNAVNDRKIRFVTGYGLEGVLPDGLTGAILDNYVVPFLNQGLYGRAYLTGIAAAAGLIAKEEGVQITGAVAPRIARRSSRKKQGFGMGGIIIFIILMIVTRGRILPFLILSSMMGGRGRGGFGGGFGGGGFGGGFGGFGGGMTGGGGAGRSY